MGTEEEKNESKPLTKNSDYIYYLYQLQQDYIVISIYIKYIITISYTKTYIVILK
jgi:hypothetical protein